MTYDEVLAELYALSTRGIEPGLERVREALARAGNPERDLRAIHVAGTNGKGSVSAMVATGLAAAGHRVALYTSPHLASLTERMRVFGVPPIDRDDVANAWSRLRDALLGPGAPRVTFFEAVTVLALSLFRERGIEVAVLEVGLGGRLDATNVLEHPLACAITRVGLDHQRLLGGDLASIAAEKAGILKPAVPAVVAPQTAEAMQVIERIAAATGAPIVRVGREVRVDALDDARVRITFDHRSIVAAPRLRGAHQRENAAVAAAILSLLEAQGLDTDVRAAIETVEWPGRLERIEARSGSFLLDAAHNEDGVQALARFLASEPRRRRVLLFGAMADKDWRPMLAVLRPRVDALVTAAPALSRAEQPDVLAEAFDGIAAPSPEQAIAIARELAGGEGEVIVAGSIYLMGEIRARLLGLPLDPPIAM